MTEARKLTKTAVDQISLTESGQRLYWDTELPGFGIRVGTSTKSYFAEGRVHGKTVRYTIGRHGIFTAEQARTEAREKLLLMAKGINPNDVDAQNRAKGVTLHQAFDAYLESRKNLKDRTIYDYKRFLGLTGEPGKKKIPSKTAHFADWRDRPLNSITKEMVAAKHRKIGQTSHAQANLAMRFLRALFYFASENYADAKGQPILPVNPVKHLSKAKAWYRVDRRKTVIKAHELKDWYQAVMKLKERKGETVRDYLLFLLYSGLRRQEAARLEAEHVDFKGKTFTVMDTKNREDHTLPMSDFVHDLLQSRCRADAKYAFPGEGKHGYLVEPRKQMAKVTKASGVEFTLHDLRRTFTTIAEGLDIPAYALKRLLNHKIPQDVTAGYIITDVERLREPMQKIADFISRTVGIKESAPVVEIQKKRKR